MKQICFILFVFVLPFVSFSLGLFYLSSFLKVTFFIFFKKNFSLGEEVEISFFFQFIKKKMCKYIFFSFSFCISFSRLEIPFQVMNLKTEVSSNFYVIHHHILYRFLSTVFFSIHLHIFAMKRRLLPLQFADNSCTSCKQFLFSVA